MLRITSQDGTPIAVWRSGGGPPLLLVHGAIADHSTTWRFVLPELEQRFTVYAMDRRGRGGSGDTAPYAIQREAEDIAAIVDSIGTPVNVLGHSYGALCAIESALLTPSVRRLILYEGVPLRGAEAIDPALIDRLDALLEAGEAEAMLITVLRDVAMASSEEIDMLRSQKDAWAVRLANASTVPRELRTEGQYVFAPERFRKLHTPTLFLVGGDSSPRDLANARGVADALTDARVVIMPGQQHLAMYGAPAMFAREVINFLER
jgi:pimeloyl-ACP methyl ester carboxylesterase